MNLQLADPAATEAAGAAIARALSPHAGVVVYLRGELGAGKTTLVRGLLRAIGITGSVRSPTYTLLEPYRVGDRSVIHLDLYRLSDPLELVNLGLMDFPPDRNWWLVEWPERGAPGLPKPALDLFLAHAEQGRLLTLRAEPQIDLAGLARGLPPQVTSSTDRI